MNCYEPFIGHDVFTLRTGQVRNVSRSPGESPGAAWYLPNKGYSPGAADLWALYPSYLIWALSGHSLDLPAARSRSHISAFSPPGWCNPRRDFSATPQRIGPRKGALERGRLGLSGAPRRVGNGTLLIILQQVQVKGHIGDRKRPIAAAISVAWPCGLYAHVDVVQVFRTSPWRRHLAHETQSYAGSSSGGGSPSLCTSYVGHFGSEFVHD
ncbi:hypothetical protein NUW54_g6041 [Trametes sanguinea]|uniref:Uncharacterized protein n=1 Tax=Trametes sanguinea TaxID=158606 RepID=A0ACC1PV88_9APHY|nr:hypothetical protein NUW54_g6041 [Trametes sanguinea]